MNDVSAKIIFNEKISGDYFRMGLEVGWKEYVPGQFAMLNVPGEVAFLRRPFGIFRLANGVLEICYKVVGGATSEMSRLSKGCVLNVLGPLGRGFEISKLVAGDLHVLVAGGYGFSPLLGLLPLLKGAEIHLFYGAKNGSHLLYLSEFEKAGINIHPVTEDGSKGKTGLVTDILIQFLKSVPPSTRPYVYACGPRGMMDVVMKITGVDCQLSLESYMACGFGVCMGCVVKDAKGEFIRVCKEGPVFRAEKLWI